MSVPGDLSIWVARDPADTTENSISAEKFDLAADTLLPVWNEFHQWNKNNCEETIRAITTEPRFLQLSPRIYSRERVSNSQSDDSDWYNFEDWDEQVSTITSYSLESPVVKMANKKDQKTDPHRPYTSCTAITKNVLILGNALETAAFLPLADDPAFDHIKYLQLFEGFGWQTRFFDPDRLLPIHCCSIQQHILT